MSTPNEEPHFVAIYAGKTVASARILAATTDPRIVQFVTEKLGLVQSALRPTPAPLEGAKPHE